jgi:3-oxoacyl-[acyl-carrier-protein] synthase-3
LPAARPGSQILGTGAYRPERVVTNEEICQYIDSSDQWIRERTGIVERRRASADESVVDMALEASGKALASAGLSAADIDTVLVATITHPVATPAAAVELAERIGAHGAAALDVSAACAGFCYALAQADALVRAASATNVLVVGVERLSDITDRTDRGTSFIFADGAGAVVVGPASTPGIGPTVWGSDGSLGHTITMTQSWLEYRDAPGDKYPALSMQGQAVYRWAISEIAGVCRRAVEAAGITLDDLDAFVPHQANMRITDSILRQLELPERVVVSRDITTTGNTSAASVPLALDALIASGQVRSGATTLLVGFGAGLAYAAQVVTLP